MATDRRRQVVVPLPATAARKSLALVARGVAVILLILIGAFHLHEAPSHFSPVAYVGILFWLATAGSWAAAAGVAAGLRGSWILGAVIAAATFAGLLLAASVGLPHFTEDLSAPFAVASLVVEGAYLAMYAAAAVARGDAAAT